MSDFHYRCDDLKLFILRLHSTKTFACVRKIQNWTFMGANIPFKVSETENTLRHLWWLQIKLHCLMTFVSHVLEIRQATEIMQQCPPTTHTHTHTRARGTSCSRTLQNEINYLYKGAQLFFRTQQSPGYSKNYPHFTESKDSVLLISNKSPTRCINFPFYYPDVYLHLYRYNRPARSRT